MSRCLLHKTKLDDFKEFLAKEGIPYRDARGDYQVLQICPDGKNWCCIYERLNTVEHFTIDRRLDSLVVRFCEETSPKEATSCE